MRNAVTPLIVTLLSASAFAGPLDAPAQNQAKRSVYGKVIQATPKGLIIEAVKRPGVSGNKAAEGTVFVKDANAPEGSTVKLQCVEDGFFDYVTVLGAEKRVPALQLVK